LFGKMNRRAAIISGQEQLADSDRTSLVQTKRLFGQNNCEFRAIRSTVYHMPIL
jgi:hypothetical protein